MITFFFFYQQKKTIIISSAAEEEAKRRAAWDAYHAAQAAASQRPRNLNQRWHYENGYIVSDMNPALVISVYTDAVGAEGAQLVLEPRAPPGTLKGQHWDVFPDGTIGSRATGFLISMLSDSMCIIRHIHSLYILTFFAAPQPGAGVGISRRPLNPGMFQRWAWRRDGFLIPQHAHMVLEAPLAPDGQIYPRVPLRTWSILP